MRQVLDTVREAVGDEFGVAVLVFDFRPDGMMSYVSNARREDMIIALREQADRLEMRCDDTAGRGEC